MTFAKGDARINRQGRPTTKDAEKPTNKSLRNKAFLQLLRKFAPLQTQAIQTAVKVMNGENSTEAGKLKASALIIQTYRDLLKETYDYKYDLDDAEPIQVEDNKPAFSLHVIENNSKNE